MRTEPHEDPAASARRRLEEFGRLWSPGPADRSAEPVVPEPTPDAPGRHAVALPSSPRPAPGAALALHRRHLGLIVLAAVLFVLVAIWWTARGAAEPMPVADTTPAAASLTPTPTAAGTSAAGPTATATTTATASPAATSGPAVVVVDVAGKVRRPTVATLPAGSRVVDAIRKAGGAKPGVDLSSINLARVLVDGEQILVGRRAPRSAGAGSGPGSTSSGASGSAATDTRTNLNTATVTELEELPGVGPVTAQKIIDWRTENGAFTSADELLEVDGIGPKTLAGIAPEVTW